MCLLAFLSPLMVSSLVVSGSVRPRTGQHLAYTYTQLRVSDCLYENIFYESSLPITSSLSSFDGLYVIISSVVFLFMFTGVSPSPSAAPFPIFPSLKHMATCLGRQLPSSKEGQINVVPYGHFLLGLGFIVVVGGGAEGLQPFAETFCERTVS